MGNYLTILFALLFMAPFSVSAAVISLEGAPATVRTGDSFLVDVLLDTQENDINAVQGAFIFPPELFSVKAIYERDTVVGVWVERPALSEAGKIFWSGIIPGGFGGVLTPYRATPAPGRLFSVQLVTLKEGQGTLRFDGATVLLHDGAGTEDEVTALPVTLSVRDDAPARAETRIADRNPPEEFIPTIERNRDVENGEWFVVFSAQDKGTGVSYYAVYESRAARAVIAEQEWEVAESPYILTDQSRRSYVYVKAVDSAGNERIVALPPLKGVYDSADVALGFAILIVLIAVPFIWGRKSFLRAG